MGLEPGRDGEGALDLLRALMDDLKLGPMRTILDALTKTSEIMGLTLEQAADLFDFIAKLKGDAKESATELAAKVSKWGHH